MPGVFTYIWMNSVCIKTAIIWNSIHNIFNLRDTDVVIYMILVLLKKADDLNHYLNIRYYVL